MSSTSSPESRPAEGARAPFIPDESHLIRPADAPPPPRLYGHGVFAVTGTELEVCRDIERRQAHGLAKYGRTVADNPLTRTQWLQHFYEELLDGAVYAKRLLPLIAQLESDLAARAVLIGELRDKLAPVNKWVRKIDENRHDVPASWFSHDADPATLRRNTEALLVRTPADAGAELARLRADNESVRGILRYFGFEVVIDALQEGDIILLGDEVEGVTAGVRVRPINGGKFDALRAQLATAEARVEKLELCNSELHGIIDNAGYPSGADYDAVSDERNSLRLQLDSLRTSYGWLEARLRAVTEAADAMYAERHNVMGAEASKRMAAACSRYDDAARSGDLPSASETTLKVYRNSPEWASYISARFPKESSLHPLSFEFAGHRWAYRHSSFDDRGDYDLLWRPLQPADMPPTQPQPTGCVMRNNGLIGPGYREWKEPVYGAGDLPPHPDTERLHEQFEALRADLCCMMNKATRAEVLAKSLLDPVEFFLRWLSERDGEWQADDPDRSVSVTWGDLAHMRKIFRAAIDAARAQAAPPA